MNLLSANILCSTVGMRFPRACSRTTIRRRKLGDLRFFASYRNDREMLLIPLTREDYFDYDWSLKLTSDIRPSMKLNISGTLGKSYNVAVNGTEQVSSTQYLRSTFDIADQVDFFPFTTSSRIFSNSY